MKKYRVVVEFSTSEELNNNWPDYIKESLDDIIMTDINIKDDKLDFFSIEEVEKET